MPCHTWPSVQVRAQPLVTSHSPSSKLPTAVIDSPKATCNRFRAKLKPVSDLKIRSHELRGSYQIKCTPCLFRHLNRHRHEDLGLRQRSRFEYGHVQHTLRSLIIKGAYQSLAADALSGDEAG